MKVPSELLIARKAHRKAERLLLDEGFYAHTRIKESKKVYSRGGVVGKF